MESAIIGFGYGLITCFVLLVAILGSFKVEEGHVASLSSFGKALRDSSGNLRLWKAGLHFKMPWHQVHLLSLMEKSLELETNDQPFYAIAQDGTNLILDTQIRVKADETDAESLLYKIQSPITHLQSYLSCVLRNEVANFGENLNPGEAFIRLRNHKRAFTQQYQKASEKQLKSQYGLTLFGLDLVDITPPDELATSLNSVQTAKAEGETQIARAHALRETRLLSAKESLEIAKAEADAAEKEIKTLGDHLAEIKKKGTLADYVTRRENEVYKKSRMSVVRKETQS